MENSRLAGKPNNYMLKTSLALLATALGLAATAHADLTWDWSFTSTVSGLGKPVSGSGTLTTAPLSGGGYVITSITGTYDGFAISGLDPAVALVSPPDNTLYAPGANGTPDNFQLSLNGLSFDFGSTPEVANIFDPYLINPPLGFYIEFDSLDNVNGGSFTAVAAPEPSQIISMLSIAGLGGIGLLLRRRK